MGGGDVPYIVLILCPDAQIHFHDVLLAEMGLPAGRKSNPIAEALMPYQPRDYAGILGAM